MMEERSVVVFTPSADKVGALSRGSRLCEAGWRLNAETSVGVPSMNRSGTMKPVLCSLLLASLCSPWSGSLGTAHLVQSPDVSIQEGGKVNISCCWTQNDEKFRISIYRTNIPTQGRSQSSSVEKSANCSFFIIDKITMEDSGIYVCNITVEIPALKEMTGNGTVINVIPKGGEEDSKKGLTAAMAVLAVVGLLILLALTGVWLVRRRRPEQVTRVIYEVPHNDSDVDKDSTGSSRGSSEWRQVPLYDYFERLQAPDKSVAVLERSPVSL